MSTKKDYLLDFSTEVRDRQQIKIDDVIYEMAVPEDFELEEFLELASAGQEASALIGGSKKDLSPERVKALTELMNKVVKQAILDLPDEVFDRLRTVQKFAVVNVFSDAVTGKLGGPKSQEQKEEPEQVDESPGQKSSQDSNDSTAEPPETG